jgi:hypothetical protein
MLAPAWRGDELRVGRLAVESASDAGRLPHRRAGGPPRPARDRGLESAALAGYTIKNLKRDVEDSAPRFGLSGLEARFPTELPGCERTGMSYQRVAPGFRIPFSHRHAEQEELYVVVAGSGRFRLDDEVVDPTRLGHD